jgi:hypothetical protein
MVGAGRTVGTERDGDKRGGAEDIVDADAEPVPDKSVAEPEVGGAEETVLKSHTESKIGDGERYVVEVAENNDGIRRSLYTAVHFPRLCTAETACGLKFVHETAVRERVRLNDRVKVVLLKAVGLQVIDKEAESVGREYDVALRGDVSARVEADGCSVSKRVFGEDYIAVLPAMVVNLEVAEDVRIVLE